VKKIMFSFILLLSNLGFSLSETYKGISEFGDEETGKICKVTIRKDDKTKSIIALKIEAPARVFEEGSSLAEDATFLTTESKAAELDKVKKFAEFKFSKQSDVQGDGYMLKGEKLLLSQNDEKIFVHFDIQDRNLSGVQFAQREKQGPLRTKVSIEKICSQLKKQ